MKASTVTSSRRLRTALVVAVAAVVSAVALSACGGGSASTATGELTQARRSTANHVHREDRLRRLEARVRRVDHRSGKAHPVPIPTYVPSAAPTIDDGTYYVPAPSSTGGTSSS